MPDVPNTEVAAAVDIEMSTAVEKIGRAIASKVNMSIGPCAVMLPLKGVSMIDAEGQPFYGPEEDAAYVIEHVPGIDGFFGATSIERLAAERGIKAQTEAFKAIKK